MCGLPSLSICDRRFAMARAKVSVARFLERDFFSICRPSQSANHIGINIQKQFSLIDSRIGTRVAVVAVKQATCRPPSSSHCRFVHCACARTAAAVDRRLCTAPHYDIGASRSCRRLPRGRRASTFLRRCVGQPRSEYQSAPVTGRQR